LCEAVGGEQERAYLSGGWGISSLKGKAENRPNRPIAIADPNSVQEFFENLDWRSEERNAKNCALLFLFSKKLGWCAGEGEK